MIHEVFTLELFFNQRWWWLKSKINIDYVPTASTYTIQNGFFKQKQCCKETPLHIKKKS